MTTDTPVLDLTSTPPTSDTVTPPDGRAWDLLVIGGGTAGLVAAKTAADLGASVLLIERARTGGDCLWTGCVPSKAMLAAAHAASDAKSAIQYGVHAQVRVDFDQVRRHVNATIRAIEPDDSPASLRASGVRVASGQARLLAADTLLIDSPELGAAQVRFRHAILATGSAPTLPPVQGLEEAAVVTSDTVWDLAELPARLLVLGGGSIGCELGQAFARLGSKVTIVEAGERLLPRESAAAAGLLTDALRADGVDVRVGSSAQRITVDTGGITLALADGSVVEGDQMLVATGRAPRTAGLGLQSAGVDCDERGYVRVDDRLRTTNGRIYAAGDVTGHPQFTHLAGVHGSLAASNAVLGLRRGTSTGTVPRVTFTQPEVAAFGASPDRAVPDSGLHVRSIAHEHVDRAVAEGRTAGLTQMVLDRHGRVVGATIVGPRAGESLPELVLAARHGLRARDVAGAVHAYPTFGDGPWKAAIEDVRGQLGGAGARAAVRALRSVQRWRSR